MVLPKLIWDGRRVLEKPSDVLEGVVADRTCALIFGEPFDPGFRYGFNLKRMGNPNLTFTPNSSNKSIIV